MRMCVWRRCVRGGADVLMHNALAWSYCREACGLGV